MFSTVPSEVKSSSLKMNGTVTMVALANSSISMIDSPSTPRSQDLELARRIDAITFRQVQNLHVVRNGERIVVRGESSSFYVKQLATHAVLDLFPGVALENAIAVQN